MKKVAVAGIIILLLVGCAGEKECPACGASTTDFYECPICCQSVCKYCADDEWYLEEMCDSDEIISHLERKNYIVFATDESPVCVTCEEPHREEDMQIVGDYYLCANCSYFLAREYEDDDGIIEYIEENSDLPWYGMVSTFH